MSGGSGGPTQTTSQYQLPNYLSNGIQSGVGNMQNSVNNLTSQIPGVQAQMNTNLGQYAPSWQGGQTPSMNTFTPTNSMQGQLNPYYQQMASQGQQQLGQQAASQQANINRQFQNQPGVSSILGQQAQQNATLQSNPLLAQAFGAQTQQQNAQNQLGLQAQQANNQAILSGQQAGLGAQQAQNAALMQQFGLGTLAPQLQGNLLQTLSALAPTVGTGTGVTQAYTGQIQNPTPGQSGQSLSQMFPLFGGM